MQTPRVALPYPWQQAQWQEFLHWHDSGKLPHALMITGSEGVGKLRLAKAMAQYLLCQYPGGGSACGSCKTCHLIAAGSHPDYKVLQPEETGKAVKIDTIRQLIEFLSKKAQLNGWKIAIIEPAEAMNSNAANALLKNLEEPQPETLLILVSHRKGSLPATIQSRCRVLVQSIPDSQKVLPWLQQVSGEGAQELEPLLNLVNGKPLTALQYLQTDQLSLREAFEDQLRGVQSGDENLIDVADNFAKMVAGQAFDWFWEYVYQQVQHQLFQKQSLANQQQLFAFQDKLLKAKADALSTANPNLYMLWEGLLIQWQSLKSS